VKRALVAASWFVLAGVGSQAVVAGEDPLRNRFIGAWKLVSTEQRLADGSRRPAPRFGPNGVGYLMYTGTHMCAVVADPNRPQWKSEQTPTDNEARLAVDGLAAYCATYEIDAKQQLVIHHVRVDAVPNSIGTLRKRQFEFSGNRLILRPVPPLPEGVAEYALTWERIED
jgi:hypothetical protein